jgi:hypothetical protein
MPVTAKLSRKFYEKFGDELTNELVEWFNQVDATYRTEFRDLFETNFGRFDAKLEQRIAEVKSEFREEIAEMKGDLRQEIAELRSELHSGLASVEGRLLARLGVLEGRFGILEGRLVKWMFLFWVASLGTSIAILQLTR